MKINGISLFSKYLTGATLLSLMACGGGGKDDPEEVILNSAPSAINVNLADTNEGAVLVGDELEGDYDFDDAENNPEGTSTYRWLSDGSAIEGATTKFYTVVASDRGMEITFEVTPIASQGTTTGSAVISEGIRVNSLPVASGLQFLDDNDLVVTENQIVGALLKADFEYSDNDEDDAAANHSYQWLRDNEEISDASSRSYTITADDSGSQLSFVVTPNAATGELVGESVQSSTLTIDNSAPVVSDVSITGEAILGSELEGSYNFVDIDNDIDAATYRWLRDGVVISEMTTKIYTLTEDDSETSITFEVSAISNAGTNPGNTATSDELVIADIAKPQVTQTSPIDGAVGVDLNVEVTATFNEALLASSVNETSFVLTQDSNNVDASVGYEQTNNIATLSTAAELNYLTQYDAKLTNSVADSAGNLLDEYNWSFTTRDRQWQDAKLVESDDGAILGRDLAVFENGDAIAIWAQSDGLRFNIWSNYYIKGQGWQDAELIEDGDGTAGGNLNDAGGDSRTGRPDLAIDNNGNAIAVWSQQEGGKWNVIFNVYSRETGWSSAAPVEQNETDDSFVPEVSMNSDGNAVVVWRQDNPVINEDLYARRYVNGAWQAIESLESDNGTVAWPQVEMNDNGDILVVWVQNTDSRWNVWAKSYSEESGWAAETTIESSIQTVSFRTKIAMNSSGNAIVSWTELRGFNSYDIYANTRVNGIWSGAEPLESDDTENVGTYNKHNVALNDMNQGVVGWQFGDDVYVNKIALEQPWSQPILISDLPIQDSFPDVGIDAKGDVIVVWQETLNAQYEIFSRRFVASTGSWDDSEVISNGQQNAEIPFIGINSSGTAMAVWAQDDSLYSNRFD